MIVGRWLLAIFFVLAGLNHFRDPAFYLAMMPPFLPAHEALNWISGACEIAPRQHPRGAVRLPFQALFMLWVWSVTLRTRAQR